MDMTHYETQIAQSYFDALEKLVDAKSTDPQSKDKAVALCDEACDLYEMGTLNTWLIGENKKANRWNLVIFADEGDFASFIDLCEEEIAQW